MLATSKEVKTCPKCGDGGPKEKVLGTKKINWTNVALILLFTGGLGLFVPKWYYRQILEFHCDKCGNTWGDARKRI